MHVELVTTWLYQSQNYITHKRLARAKDVQICIIGVTMAGA